jgi:arsenical pump membrane protein
LTFTPFICFFCKQAKIDPVPYLFAEFVAANTWSMALIIGNPTNIYLASNFNVGFFDYLSIMVLPTISGGIVSLILLYLIFKNKLKEPLSNSDLLLKHTIKDKFLLTLGLIHLVGCIILLAISSYINLEMWLICLVLCLSELVISTTYLVIKRDKLHLVTGCLRRAPYELIPFVLSMFIVVLGVNNSGLTEILSSYLTKLNTIYSFGITSFLTCNLINNIPMSVLFANLSTSGGTGAVFASVVGSNLGALLTPIGALAGIMWCNLLKIHNLKFSFKSFIKYGVIVSIPTLIVTLTVLLLVL